jgi:hypothetical protein
VTVVCRRCRRPLRSPLWRARRIGPACARKDGLVWSRECPSVLVWSVRAAVVAEGQMTLFDVAGTVDARLEVSGKERGRLTPG